MHTKASKELKFNIDEIWDLLNNDQLIKEIDPKVILNEPIELKEGKVGSTYRQQYQEGKKIQEYIVEVSKFEDTKGLKRFGFTFDLAKVCHIEAEYTLKAITHTRTQFTYEVEQQPLSFGMKIMFKLMPKSIVNKQTMAHIEKIEELLAKK